LRGEVVPVIDLSVRLGRQPITIHKRTCIIVIELHTSEQHCVLGLLADAVNEVIDISSSNIEDAPAFGAKIRAEFIQGIAKKGDEFIVLLDAEKTLSPRELAHLVEAELQ
jgi:purine-binding chemotaxis protein CheW